MSYIIKEMIYRDKTFDQAGITRPKDTIDPKVKQNDPRWSCAMAKYIYSKWLSNQSAINEAEAREIEIAWSYALASQDVQQYMDQFSMGKNEQPPVPRNDVNNPDVSTMDSARKGWVNMSFGKIFSPIPKTINVIISMLMAQEHSVPVHAIDEKSVNDRENKKFNALAQSYMEDITKVVEERLAIQPDPNKLDIVPRSIEEADMLAKMGNWRLAYEIGMNMLMDYTNSVSHQDQLKEQTLADLIVGNCACTIPTTNPATGQVENHRHSPLDVILENDGTPFFKRSTYFGVQEYFTITRLRECSSFTEDELLKIANMFCSKFGNPTTINTLGSSIDSGSQNVSYRMSDGSMTYDEWKIPVLYFVVKSFDDEYYTTRYDEKGGKKGPFYEPYTTDATGKMNPPKVYDTDKRKTEGTRLSTLYKGYWVMTTDHVFDYGRFTDIPYNYALNEIPLPINFIKLPGHSLVHNAETVEDKIYITFLRMENAIAKAPPPGIKIEWGSLEGITIDEKKFTAMDALMLYSHTGDIIWKMQPAALNQPANSGKTIEELRGGLGGYLTEMIATMEFYYNQLAEIMGVDRISAVSKQPSGEMAVKVTEIAVAATNNAIRPIYSSYLHLKVNQTRINVYMLQSVLLTDRGKKLYSKVISKAYIDAINAAGNNPPVEWGFIAEAEPSEGIKQNVIAMAQKALSGGKNGNAALRVSEYLFLVRNLNTLAGVVFAEAYIQYKEAERDAKDEAEKKALIELQTKGNVELEKAKIETLKQKVAAETKGKLTLADQEHQNAIELEILKHENLMKQLKAQNELTKSNTNEPTNQNTK